MRNLYLMCLFALMAISNGYAQEPGGVTWEMSDKTRLTGTTQGLVVADDAFISDKLYAQDWNSSKTGQHVRIQMAAYLDNNNTEWWTSEQSDAYVQFAMTAKEGAIFTPTKIEFGACSVGGSDMCANFYYSTDETFANKTQINYKKGVKLQKETFESIGTADISGITLKPGEKIYFRVYPYYKSSAKGKSLGLADISITGTFTETEATANAVWAFTENTSATTSGVIAAKEMSFGENAKVYGYRSTDASLDGTEVVNGTFCPTAANCGWTASTDTVAGLYAEFVASPKNGAEFTVKEVSLYIAATGTNAMKATVYASKDGFKTATCLKEVVTLPTKALEKWTLPVSEVILSGNQEYAVRVYPFMPMDATFKLCAVRDVTISGTTMGGNYDPAELSTSAVSYISTTFATGGGTIKTDGGSLVSASGLVWGTAQAPELDAAGTNKTTDGAKSGAFVSKMEGLTAGTTYYVRAYATTKAGTAYGEEISFATLAELVVPTVEISGTSNVRNVSAEVSGKVVAWGGADVTERGIILGTSSDLTLENAIVTVESGKDLGTYKCYFTGLTPETEYTVRAYAKNSVGIGYSEPTTFSTKATEPTVTKKVNADGTGDYTTIEAAFAAVPTDYTGKWIIEVAPGTYKEKVSLAKGKVNVVLKGMGATPKETVLTYDAYADTPNGQGGTFGTSNSYSVDITADDFIAYNLTFENTHKNQGSGNNQAVALRTAGDRQSFYNCRITGYQDTYLGNSNGRAYFKNCYVEGNVDFMFGRQTCLFDQCTTYVNRDGSVLVAPATEKETLFGFVFLDCKLTSPASGANGFDGKAFKGFHFGRPWQGRPRAAFIRCEAPATLQAKGWTTMNANLNPVFVEFGTTGAGAPSSASVRGNEGRVITAEEASIYTIENVFKKETHPSFATDWMPAPSFEEALNPTSICKEVVAEGEVISTEYYTISGMRVSAPQKGLNIIRKTYENGAVIVDKVIMK